MVQTVLGLVVALLEFVGLGTLQRQILETAYTLYWPALALMAHLATDAIATQGNVLFGFMSMGFAIVLYAALIGAIVSLTRCAADNLAGKNNFDAAGVILRRFWGIRSKNQSRRGLQIGQGPRPGDRATALTTATGNQERHPPHQAEHMLDTPRSCS